MTLHRSNKNLVRIPGSILLFLVWSICCWGQNCQAIISEATDAWNNGRYNDAVALVEKGLAECHGDSSAILLTIKIKSLMELGEPSERIKKEVKDLLKMHPEYKPAQNGASLALTHYVSMFNRYPNIIGGLKVCYSGFIRPSGVRSTPIIDITPTSDRYTFDRLINAAIFLEYYPIRNAGIGVRYTPQRLAYTRKIDYGYNGTIGYREKISYDNFFLYLKARPLARNESSSMLRGFSFGAGYFVSALREATATIAMNPYYETPKSRSRQRANQVQGVALGVDYNIRDAYNYFGKRIKIGVGLWYFRSFTSPNDVAHRYDGDENNSIFVQNYYYADDSFHINLINLEAHITYNLLYHTRMYKL